MSLTFSEHLWGGIKTVYDRYESGKDSLHHVISFLKDRIELEEKYSKKIETLVTKSVPLNEKGHALFPTTKEDIHYPKYCKTIGDGWAGFRQWHENVYKQHAIVLSQLQTTVTQPIATLKKEQEASKAALTKQMQKWDSDLAKGKEGVLKQKQKYQKACRDLETSTLALRAADDPANAANVKPKELNKLRTQVATDKESAEQSHVAYQANIKEFHQLQKKYEEAVRKILADFQDLEVKRLQKMKEIWVEFIKTQESLVSSLKEHVPALKESISQINETKDINDFIDTHKTNQTPEPLIVYEPYVSDKGVEVPADKVTPLEVSGPMNVTKQAVNIPGAEAAVKSSPSTESKSGKEKKKDQEAKSEDKEAKAEDGKAADATAVGEGGAPSGKPEKPEKPPKKDRPSKKKSSTDGSEEKKPRKAKSKKLLRSKVTKDESASDPASATAGGDEKGDKQVSFATPDKDDGEAAEPIKTKALFNYEAQDETEISFQEGDEITVLKNDGSIPGWMEGEIDGKRGLFPANYVELGAEPEGRRCVALFDFTSENPDELDLKEGEILWMLVDEGEGWYTGKNEAGKVGLFPANYIEFKED